MPQDERRARLEAVARRRASRRSTSRRPRRTAALAADWFDRFEGAGLDGVDRQAARRPVPAGQAGDAQDQAPAHRRLRRGRLPLAQERPGHADRLAAARPLRRRGHAAPRRRHLVVHDGPRAPSWSTELAPLRENALEGHPWARLGRAGPRSRRASGQRVPGATQPLEPRQGPVVGAAPAGARRARSPTTTSRAIASATRTTFVRWRPDKPPADCRYDQLEETPAVRAREHLW